MSAPVLGLVLFAAFLHAGWNTLLRGGADRLWSMSVINIAVGGLAVVGVAIFGLPARESWPFVVVSGVLHLLYNALLVLTYRSGDLGQTYPIARGSSPALVSLGAAVFAREYPDGIAVLGILLVSAGILSLAPQRGGLDRASLLAALATGVSIAAYTLVDGLGVRVSGDWLAYTCAMFCFHLALPAWLVWRRGFAGLRAPRLEFAKALGGGVTSIGAYGLVIWAMQLGAMGAVSALRETSVVFAAVLGWLFLGERLSVARVASCLVIAAGAALIGHG